MFLAQERDVTDEGSGGRTKELTIWWGVTEINDHINKKMSYGNGYQEENKAH